MCHARRWSVASLGLACLGRGGVCLMLAMALSLPVQAKGLLRVLAWTGYADGDLVKRFEQRLGASVEVTIVSSDDQLREKLAAREGRGFDVFAANTAELQRYIDQGLVQPLSPVRIPNIARQQPQFRVPGAVSGIHRAGQLYAVPYAYSEMGLIYDRRQFPEGPPSSLEVLWDPRFRGRVLAFDDSTQNFSLAAQQLGVPPFRIGADDWGRMTQSLIALRRNALSFYKLPEEATELFLRHRVAVMFAAYGSQQLKQLRDAGADVGYALPREGALAWLDCWAIVRGSPQARLAEQWIDYMLEPGVSGELTRRHGLANTVDPAATAATGVTGGPLVWLEPVEDPARRSMLWRRIRAGDRPTSF